MASTRRWIEVLNYCYIIIGILSVIGTIQTIYFAIKFKADTLTLPIILSGTASVLIIAGFIVGRKALQNNQARTFHYFSALVCISIGLQVQGQIISIMGYPTTVGHIFKQEFITRYDTLDDVMKKFIEQTQQDFGCCAIFGYKDYTEHMHISQVPVSCCGKYPQHIRFGQEIDRCSSSELEKTPGCKDKLFQIIRKNVPGFLFFFIIILGSVLSLIVIILQVWLAVKATFYALKLSGKLDPKIRQNSI